MKISKIYLRIYSLLFACFLVCGSILRSVVTYASPYDLMIGSSSNALMTLELDDSDYLMMAPRSSLANITNTVNYPRYNFIEVMVYNMSTGKYRLVYPAYTIDSGVDFSFSVGSDEYIYQVYFILSECKPPNGNYLFSLDYASDFSYDYANNFMRIEKITDNASNVVKPVNIPYTSSSGDLFIDSVPIRLGNVSNLSYRFAFNAGEVRNIGGFMKINFTPTDQEPVYDFSFNSSASSDYQDSVSSSLGDLSSSVDSMTEDLSSAAENLEYISTSQNLIIQGIDNVVMHISDQLFAFWNQLFNLIHVPTMAKMDDIIDAINNMDLEIEVNLDGLKTTINNMSSAVQNKLQSTTDQITGGYDNSGMTSDKSELDGVLNQYEQAEEDLFEDAKGNINDFEFETPLEQFTGPLSDVSYFLSGLFEAMGPMNVIITFSLTLTIAMVMIGWYRFKGGR